MAKVPNGVESLPKCQYLSRTHEGYRLQTDRRQTDDKQTDDDIIANVNVSSLSLKIGNDLTE